MHGIHATIGDRMRQAHSGVIVAQPQILQTLFLQAAQRQPHGLGFYLVADEPSLGHACGRSRRKSPRPKPISISSGRALAVSWRKRSPLATQGSPRARGAHKRTAHPPGRQDVEIRTLPGIAADEALAGLPIGVVPLRCPGVNSSQAKSIRPWERRWDCSRGYALCSLRSLHLRYLGGRMMVV